MEDSALWSQWVNVRLSFPAVSGQPVSESECNLVDSLLYDIRSGFQQSKGLDSNSRDLRVSTAGPQFSVSFAPLKVKARCNIWHLLLMPECLLKQCICPPTHPYKEMKENVILMNVSCFFVGVGGCVDQAPHYSLFQFQSLRWKCQPLYVCVCSWSCLLFSSAFKRVKLPLSNNKNDLISICSNLELCAGPPQRSYF